MIICLSHCVLGDSQWFDVFETLIIRSSIPKVEQIRPMLL